MASECKPAADASDETAVRRLIDGLANAWNRGDARAYSERYQPDGTFTNVNGSLFVGREAFEQRHAEIFSGIYKDVRLSLTIKRLSFIRPDVALVDLDAALDAAASRVRMMPSGVQAGPDGVLHTSLQMVLVKESDGWWIASYHNVWLAAGG